MIGNMTGSPKDIENSFLEKRLTSPENMERGWVLSLSDIFGGV